MRGKICHKGPWGSQAHNGDGVGLLAKDMANGPWRTEVGRGSWWTAGVEESLERVQELSICPV